MIGPIFMTQVEYITAHMFYNDFMKVKFSFKLHLTSVTSILPSLHIVVLVDTCHILGRNVKMQRREVHLVILPKKFWALDRLAMI